jgi:hypothetical protein
MTLKKKQGRSCKERKAFIVGILDRFLPKVPDPFIQRLTALMGSRNDPPLPEGRGFPRLTP